MLFRSEAGCNPVVVVTGAHEAAVRTALGELPIHMAVNARWQDGIGTSIQTGLAALDAEDVEAAVLMLADQVLVGPRRLRELVDTQRTSGAPIVAASYAGTVGVPACFARSAFPHLLALGPTAGCKGVILAHIEEAVLVPCPEAEADVDTPDDLARLEGDAAADTSTRRT